MNERREDDVEDGPPRSYCVFERDRDLPRPTPSRPLMAEAATRDRAGRVIVAGGIGVALGAAVVAWWFRSGMN